MLPGPSWQRTVRLRPANPAAPSCALGPNVQASEEMSDMARLTQSDLTQALDDGGNPVAGALRHVYHAGTTGSRRSSPTIT